MLVSKKTLYSIYIKSRGLLSPEFSNYLKKGSVLVYFSDFNVNWGDHLNLHLFRRILDVPVVSSKRIFNINNKKRIYGIGSILSTDLKDAVIWGSGFIKDTPKIHVAPDKILALRGKHTEAVFKRNSIAVPGLYGDPALLFPRFYDEVKSPVKYKLGIIPHYKELKHPVIQKLAALRPGEITVISPLSSITSFAEQILSCETIISRSLHGLILSEAYGRPTCRFTLTDEIIGGDFKFNDYYSGVGIDSHPSVNLNDGGYHEVGALYKLPTEKVLRFDADGLVKALRTEAARLG
jgi:pyruvyltransferase